MFESARMKKLMRVTEMGVDMQAYLKMGAFMDSLQDNENTRKFDEAVDLVYRVYMLSTGQKLEIF
jgi:hypothetical protein